MNELYWITRLGSLYSAGVTFMVISGVALIFLIILYIANSTSDLYDSNSVKICNKLFKITIPIFVVSLFMAIFIPTTKEALLIYGVGGTMDYLKENPTAKQLPDKCIKALDKWVDDLTEDKKKEEK